MKQSQAFIPTMREMPSDAEIVSHKLLLRAGVIRQNASGIYSYLPLGKKILSNIETVIREEMEAIGAVEVLMPALQPAELWQETERWYSYGPELFRVKDRHRREFALGATHEEMITSLVRAEVKSYKEMPLTLFQIQTKYRDEQRPRFGLLRGREFIMKDAYSFHSTVESLDEKYQDMKQAYTTIFTRLGLDFRTVIADGGAIGGTDTHEFMALSEIGEDTIAYSDSSPYAANVEMAEIGAITKKSNEPLKKMEKIETPNQRKINEITSLFDIEAAQCIKTLIFKADDDLVAILCRGDHEINDIKLKNILSATTVEFAHEEEISKLLSCEVGSIGPVKLPIELKVIADHAVAAVINGVCGANEDGFHYINVNPERDFAVDRYADLRFIQEGDVTPDGNGTIKFAKGIELGHIFKLGTTYSEPMEATFLDENDRTKPYQMGCYGIGVSRIMAAVAEQCNDENGLKWPKNLAPFDIHLIAVNVKDEIQKDLADSLYKLLKSYRFEVLYDDRTERAGVKFADSDLIGLPVRITIGKKAAEGIVEVKYRASGETLEWAKEEITEKLQAFFGAE